MGRKAEGCEFQNAAQEAKVNILKLDLSKELPWAISLKAVTAPGAKTSGGLV